MHRKSYYSYRIALYDYKQQRMDTVCNGHSDGGVRCHPVLHFFFTKGDVTDGVLWYMAQSLTFAGAIFGVSVYFKTKLGESEYRIKEFINNQIKPENNETN